MKISNRNWVGVCLSIATIFFVALSEVATAATSTQLSSQGKASLPIIVSAGASEPVKKHAATLAQYLGKISGAKFEVQAGDGQSGIVVGTNAEFVALPISKEFGVMDATQREDYILRSHAKGVYLIGTTDLAVQHAVWDLLHRLGYRHFFPGKNWEVVPSTPSLNIAVDEKEQPDYLARRLWYGFGSWKDNRQDKTEWDTHNRMATSLDIKSGHAYDTIYKANKAEFDKHPEYLASAHPVKFCVSNPGLRKLVIEHALRYFEKNRDEDSISMEPSDGGGWDSEGACRDSEVYQTVTDRVVTLANEVAEAVNKKYKNKYVGIYAYYQHSPPPSIKVHPKVAVQVAAGYIQGGWTMNGLLEGWSKQGVQLIGIREYYSVFSLHWDRPAGPVASSLTRIKTTTPHYYNMGARLMSAESSESWGPAGLSYYLASRLLWDTKANPDLTVNDFLEKSFGPGKEEMRQFYSIIDRANQPLFTRDLIGRMYRRLDAARKSTDNPGIRARLDDLVLWTRYCEMLWEWQNVLRAPADRKALGEQMLKFTYRWHSSAMMHSYVLWRHSFKLAGGRINLKKDGHPYPKETHFNSPPDKNPWMSNEPIPAEDIESFVQNGLKNNPIAEFVPVKYSRDLIPATKLGLKSEVPGGFDYTRMEQNYYLWIDKAPATIPLEVLGGQIATRGNTTLSLYEMKDGKEDTPLEVEADEDGEVEGEDGVALAEYDGTAPAIKDHAVDTVDVPNDKELHKVELKAKTPGLHRLRIVDRGKGVSVKWPRGLPIVVESSKTVQTLLRGRNMVMYFYVPKGTKVVGGFASSKPTLVDGSGKAVATLSADPAMFSVPVPPGQDGKLWRIDRVAKVLLMTVPPYLSRSADELLLPREVVEADVTP